MKPLKAVRAWRLRVEGEPQVQAGDGRTPDPGGGDSAPDADDHVDFRQGVFRGQVVGKMIVNHGRRRPDRPAPCTLPMAQGGFTGRAGELAALAARLGPPVGPAPDAPLVCVVTGLGGMGKTALALKAAHRARNEGWFTGGALFLDLAGYDDNPVNGSWTAPAAPRRPPTRIRAAEAAIRAGTTDTSYGHHH